MRVTAIFLGAGVLACLCARAVGKVSLADLATHAIERSQFTLAGSRPFHLKAKVFETTDRDNDSHNADIEEYWVAPDKWRRTVKTAEFSQTLIVNGEATSEQLTGDYYPHWLRILVDAIFDPGAALNGLDMSSSSDNPMLGGDEVCRRFEFRAGAPPVTNKVFSSFCFRDGLLTSVGKPGYDADYGNYKKFGEKQVARKIGEYIESGTELGATMDELTELNAPDESLFVVQQSGAPLRAVAIKEESLRRIAVSATAIQWPTLTSGINPGTLSIYVCVDREGRVRETYALNSSNPLMTQAAREQVMKWQFAPAANAGVPAEVESILTCGYDTKFVPGR